MKAISFSLFGDQPKYLVGMLRNAELAQKVYPDWTVRIYLGGSPRRIDGAEGYVRDLLRLDCEIIPMDANPWCPPMMQRFLVADDPRVERFIVRDADSRLSAQEAAAVKEWEAEDKILHSCRAHPAHGRPINGGMWGATWRRNNWQAPEMAGLIRDYLTHYLPLYKGHDPDQDFLCQMIWPWAKCSCTNHGLQFNGFPLAKPFPMPWPEGRFMGQVVEIAEDGTEIYRKD